MLLLSFTQFRRLILACLILPLAMHSTGFAQRSSLPFALRVLYDSFEARMEMVEGEWWLEMPDLIEHVQKLYLKCVDFNNLFNLI